MIKKNISYEDGTLYLDAGRKLFSIHNGADVNEVSAWGIKRYRESSYGRSKMWENGFQMLLKILMVIYSLNKLIIWSKSYNQLNYLIVNNRSKHFTSRTESIFLCWRGHFHCLQCWNVSSKLLRLWFLTSVQFHCSQYLNSFYVCIYINWLTN